MGSITSRQILRLMQLTQTEYTDYRARNRSSENINLKLLLVNLSHVLVFFYGAACDEPEDSDVPSLTQAKRSILRLQIPAANIE